MEFANQTCAQFVQELSSNAPIPGGGGAAALVGAIGTALGAMVGALTVGKQKYAAVEDEMIALGSKCAQLQAEFLNMIDEDAACFAPLAAAYRLPKDAPQRAEKLEAATKLAAGATVELMDLCCKALDCISVFAEKGTRLAISDAACAALFCKAALQGASLTLFINTKSLQDRALADELNTAAGRQLCDYCAKADEIHNTIAAQLRT